MKKYLAELVGTFALVFFGTGAILVDQSTGGSLGLVGIALAFGITVIAMIYSFGLVSGAHINPVVTVSFWLGKTIQGNVVLGYLIAQFLGAIVASFLLRLLFPASTTMGATLPSGSALESFVIELVFTSLLVLTIIVVSSNKRTARYTGLVVGCVLIGIILITGPISGGSFNPARSVAPVLFSGNYSSLWIYLTAPMLGGIAAMGLWRVVFRMKGH